MQKKMYSLIAILVFICSTAMAQVTTSSINGKVVAGDEEVIGATVVAVHTPSGTRYNAVTNDKGRYSIQGMRVGGPYTVTISYVGYKNEVLSNINLVLGNSTVLNADLKEDAQLLNEVQVTGKAIVKGLGASTNFSQTQIENAPTVNRDIYDVAKLSPLVNTYKNGGISIAGTNNRYNSFQIDGMVSNDVFGLSGTGTNGGKTGANPINLDAIEQIQVVASPFDVRQSGFTGGAINAITKSGTNEFKGSAYTYYTNKNLYGKWSQLNDRRSPLADETTKTFGATFGGPIIKDKLFFFINAEYKKDTYPSTYHAGAENYFLTTETAAAIAQQYARITGIQESYNPRSIDTKIFSLMGRIDWNINEKNKLAFRYQLSDSNKDFYSTGMYTFYFNNSQYKFTNHTNSFVLELNSRINDNLYNEFRAGATIVRDKRTVPYQGPTVQIDNVVNPNNTSSRSNRIYIGTEFSSGVNYLNQNIYTIEDNLSWTQGNHTFTFGTHNEIYDLKNGFIQNSNGRYQYSGGIDQFLNNAVPYRYYYNYSDVNITGTTTWGTPFQAAQIGLYAQDKWDISTRFALTYGLRFDIPIYLNNPSENTEFNSTSYSINNDAIVGRKPYSTVMFSPRLGFRWFLDENQKSQIRGGVGIFNGRAPFVWLENAWANTGVELKGTTMYSPNTPRFEDYGANAGAALNDLGGTASKPLINTVSPRFKFPQVARFNLAYEQVLPYDIKLSLEGLYSRNFNNVWFENLALIDNGNKVYAVNPDYAHSATTYYSVNTGSYSNIINMTNTNKGYSYSISAKLEKSFNFGLDLMASYTFGHSYSVNDGTSSVALSNWGYYYGVDPNRQDLSFSMFDVPHRVLAVIAYNSKRYGKKRWQSHVSLTYNGSTGLRYSLTMSESSTGNSNRYSFNGDSWTGNTLLYIPTEEELAVMQFANATDRASYGAWIANDKYASKHRGQYAKRNSNTAPWENHFDFHFSQDFYYNRTKGSKIELIFDIINASNLINKKWGTYYADGWNRNILQVTAVTADANGNYIPTYRFVGQEPVISDFYSRWHAQLGLRVTF